MILLIDNYDSFTYNLVDYIEATGQKCVVYRNDEPLESYTAAAWDGVVLSPGPGRPEQAGNLMQVIEHYHDKKPILGICLGHQALGQYFGAKLQKAPLPVHGKVSEIIHNGDKLFEGISRKTEVVRYHSLVLESAGDGLECIASTYKDNLIMAIKHKKLPLWGLQFHPEAVLTMHGKLMISNWIEANGIKKIDR